MASPSREARRRWLWPLKVVVSLGLLGWVVRQALSREGVDGIWQRLGDLHAGYLGLAVGLHFASVLAGSLRWQGLLAAAGVRPGLGWLLRHYLIGRFVGAFTPSVTGLDGYRLYAVSRREGAFGPGAGAILVEKFVGLLGLSLVTLALLPLGALSLLGRPALLAALLVAAGAGVGLYVLGRPDAVAGLLGRLPGRLSAPLRKLLDAVASRSLSRGTLALAIALSVSTHLTTSAVFFATARALGVGLDAGTLLVLGNAIVIATLLPISVGGVGVREGVAVVLLGAAGVGATEATLTALLGYLTGQAPALLGGLLSLGAPRPEPSVPAQAELGQS